MSASSVELNLPSDGELQNAGESDKTYKNYGKKEAEKKKDMIKISKEELKFRKKKSDDILQKEKLPCTTCGKNLKSYLSSSTRISSHPILGVLLCKSCAEFYGEGEFSVDEDGTDKYCRWCGQGGTLYLCSKCNFGFCRACIKRNLNRTVLKDVDEDDWKCFSCKPYPLWDLRAVCDATLKHVETQKKMRSKIEPKPSTSKSSGKLICVSSSETDGEQITKKKSKQKKKDDNDSYSDTSATKKRKRHDSNEELLEKKKKKKKNSSDSVEVKNENKSQYSKKLDRGTTLDTKSAEILVSKCKEHIKDMSKVLNAISSEIKKILKEEVVVENMVEYAGRKNILSKLIMLQEMSCESITQVFDNFALGYQSGIVSCVFEDSKGNRTSSENLSAIPEKIVSEEIEETNKIENVEEESKITNSTVGKNAFSESDSSEEITTDKTKKNKDRSKTDSSINELEVMKTKPTITMNAFSETEDSDEEMLSDKINKTDPIKTLLEADDSDESLSGNKSKKEQMEICESENSEKKPKECDSDKSSEHKRNKTRERRVETTKENICGNDVSESTKVSDVIEDDKLSDCDRAMEQDDTIQELNKKVIDDESCSNDKEIGDATQSDNVSDSERIVSTPQHSDKEQEDKSSKNSDHLINDFTSNEVCEGENNPATNARRKISDKDGSLGSNENEEECENNISNGKVCEESKQESDFLPQIPKKLFKKQQIEKSECGKKFFDMNTSDEEIFPKKDLEAKAVRAKTKTDVISKASENRDSDKGELNTSDRESKLVTKKVKEAIEKKKSVVLSDEDVISDSGSEKRRKKKDATSGCNDSPNENNRDNATDSNEDTCSKMKTVPSFDNLLNDIDNLPDRDVGKKLEDMNKELKTNCVSEPVETHSSQNGISNENDESNSDDVSTSLLSDEILLSKKSSDLSNVKDNSTNEKALFDNQSISEDEKKALLSLLASSSDEDSISSLERKIKVQVGSDKTTEKYGPLSSKSLRYQIAHKKTIESKSGVFSDVNEDSNVDSANDLKHSRKSSSKDIESSEESRNPFTKCSVILERLPEDVYKKHAESSSGLENNEEKSETEEIKKLVNLRNLDKVSKKKIPSVDSELESDEEPSVNKKKVFRKHAKKKDKKTETLMDFHDKDDTSSHSDHSGSSDQGNKRGSELKNIFAELLSQKNKLAKELLLRSSSSDSDIFSKKDSEKKKNEKKKESEVKVKEESEGEKVKVKEESEGEKAKVKEESEGEKAKVKEEKDSDESDTELKKKKKWRSDRLLRMRLSETDTSEDERKWKAKKERELKEEKKERKSVVRRIINSDSDSVVISSESPESSDSDDFKPMMKRKRKENSDGSKSDKKSSGSGSDFSTKKKPKRRRIRKPISGSDDSDEGDGRNNSQKSDNTPGKGRKNIRKVLKDEDVTEATRRAAKEEEERRKRIAEKQKLYNALYNLAEAQSETIDKLVLDFDSETKKELLQVDKSLVTKLKPHQVKGVKFMWDACFESLEEAKKGEGSGCILAHCMGLGKTLQVITLVHTVLNIPKTKIKTVLVVCPLSTVLNWVNEFSKWLDQTEDNDIEVLELTRYKQMYERIGVLKHWHESGGVMILAYNSYRTLSNPKIRRQKKRNIDTLQATLVDPGPDLVICDEGHLLKNEGSALSKAMNCIRTKRRIVLTGTPLQNNLLEYHCMVQFVKPNLLGTKKEFQNRFVNPINNGQYGNSTAYDVKVMKRRAHVLHKMLDSSVQRYDYSVLTPFLPPKFEYVLLIKLTELQIKLYKHFLENFAHCAEGTKTKTASLFSDFHALQRIWTHPRVLLMNSEKMEKKRILEETDSEGSLKDFVVSTTSEESSSSDSSVEEIGSSKPKQKRKTRSTVNNESDEEKEEPAKSSDNEDKNNENENTNSKEWWQQFITDESTLNDINQSGKLALLFKILEECEKIGDKILIFSQSLQSLDLIEYFLRRIDEESDKEDDDEGTSKPKQSWVMGLDYFRLDGSSTAENRAAWCKTFNREDNYRARVFLISTRAGGLGINLVSANRVILFDASWNPSHDLQSIFRIYRFGQKKPCYVYRFLAQYTMEEKVYNRQVTKLSLACRVVDEQQIERHFSMDDLQELYNFNPEEKNDKETPLVPKDVLLAELVKGEDSWINTYHEHDTLLENKEEEELNEEERKAAWDDYEKEKQGIRQNVAMNDTSAISAYLSQFGYSEPQIRQRVIRENPNWSEIQVTYHVNKVVRQIWDYVSQEEHRKAMLLKYSKQPVFYQNPQVQPLMQMQTYPQYGNNTMLNMSIQPQGSTAQTPNAMPSTSLLGQRLIDDGQNRIKVKSFGHMQNSNFGNNPQVMTNPFAVQHSAGAGTLPTVSALRNLPQVSLKNQSGGTRNQLATKSTESTDVIEVE